MSNPQIPDPLPDGLPERAVSISQAIENDPEILDAVNEIIDRWDSGGDWEGAAWDLVRRGEELIKRLNPPNGTGDNGK